MTKAIIPTDIFVVLPGGNGQVVFAKNSHRPRNEVQEIIYAKGNKRDSGSLKCTYIEIPEFDGPTNSVILSKPAWMWGAEMGSNDKNVCIGNIALRSRYNEDDADSSVKRLLGMDLVRIALERCSSAEGCVDMITNLLNEFGQGGPCAENDPDIFYHNAFVIVDPNEGWLIETCGKFWAAVKIESTHKHFSNGYTIQTKIDKMSDGLMEQMQELNLWNGEGEFNFAKCLKADDVDDYHGDAEKLIDELYTTETISTANMFKILRNKDNNICRTVEDYYPTQGSQMTCLSESALSVHWLTGTPDPSVSVYKPFVFTPNARISHHTISVANDRNRHHLLYNLHSKQSAGQLQNILELLQTMEDKCVNELAEFSDKYAEGASTLQELDDLMKDCIETEVKFYR
ncbi:secernin-2 [Arctopsyche grandis]|uniref:secernin-2 n=1 Tax=Arctopsyche grandis TaxID=121162 RepID=UPI00406D6A28